jgi:hypothetical protein
MVALTFIAMRSTYAKFGLRGLALMNRTLYSELAQIPGMQNDMHAAKVMEVARSRVMRTPTFDEIRYVATAVKLLPIVISELNTLPASNAAGRAELVASLRRMAAMAGNTKLGITFTQYSSMVPPSPFAKSLLALFSDPDIHGTDIGKAVRAQQRVAESVSEKLVSLGIGRTAFEQRSPMSADAVNEVAKTLLDINRSLPASAKADPYIRNMMFSLGYHLLSAQPVSREPQSVALSMGRALDALALPQCPANPAMPRELWLKIKEGLIPWMQDWSNFLTVNAKQVSSEGAAMIPLTELPALSSVRFLVLNDAIAVGDANAFLGRRSLTDQPPNLDVATHIDRDHDFPFVFGQGVPSMRLMHGLMPAMHEIHNSLGMTSRARYEYSPAYNLMGIPLNVQLSLESMTKGFRDAMRGNMADHFRNLEVAKQDLKYDAATRRLNFDKLPLTIPGADVDPLSRVVGMGLIDAHHANGPEVTKFFQQLRPLQGKLDAKQAAELIKTYRQVVHPKMVEMGRMSVTEQTAIINRSLAVRYLMQHYGLKSLDPSHIQLLQKNPPKDLLQLSNAQMEKVLRGLGSIVKNGEVAGVRTPVFGR